MKSYTLLGCLLAVFVRLATSDRLEDPKREEEYPYLVAITYNVKIEKFPNLIQHVIVSFPRDEIDGKLSLKELIEFTKVQNITLEAAKDIVKSLKLEKYITLQAAKHTLDRLNVSISDVYQNFTATFKLGPEISKAFEVLNINFFDFIGNTYAKKDEELFKVILSGTYTKESVREALEIIKLNKSSIFEFFKPIVFEKLGDLTIKDVLQCFDEIGAHNVISAVIKAQNIEIANVSNVNILGLVGDFEDRLKMNETMGVQIGDRQVLTHMDVYLNNERYRDFVDLEVEDINFEKAPVDTARLRLENSLLMLEFNFPNANPHAVLQVLDRDVHNLQEHGFENCVYLSGYLHEYIESVHIPVTGRFDSLLFFQKTNDTMFRHGSPLVCQNLLYGLASYETEERIYFTHVSSSGRMSVSVICVAIFSSILVLVK